jgi:outer membrane protein
MRNQLLILGLILVLTPPLRAQQTLTLKDAVSLALNKNFQIQIARNEAEISRKQNSAGAAGMLPNVMLNASDNPSLNNLRQELTNGTLIQQDNVLSNNLNTNVMLGYTLFDGMRMFATRKRLQELEAMGQNRLKAQIQNTLSDVIQRYSYLSSQQSYMSVVEKLRDISLDRYKIVEVRVAAGLANNTDLYFAQLDVDTWKQNVISQQIIIKNAYTDLNVVINLPADSVYSVDEAIVTDNTLNKSRLDSSFAGNPELMMAQNQVNIALQSEKEVRSARMPLLRMNAGYGYTLVQSQAGFTLLNQTYGPLAGLTFSLPLYTGNVNANNVAIAKLQAKNAQLNEQQVQLNFKGSFEQAWFRYTNTLKQVENDEVSVNTAKQYLDLMEQRYKLGQSTVLDFREAQRSYEETNYRLISNRYLLKLSETDLLRLTGTLVSN